VNNKENSENLKLKESKKEKVNNSIDKLRDELFDYRLDIKAYIKNLNTIIISGSILISVLTFFGYTKIENIEQTIMEKANERLAVTDLILSKINQERIDSLNLILIKKEENYQKTISNFEKIVSLNKELENQLFKSLPENKRTESKTNTYIEEYPTNYFKIRPFKTKVQEGELINLYVVINDGNEIKDEDYFSVKVYPKGRRVLLLSKEYIASSKFNKFSFGINKFENYKEYELEVALFRNERNDTYMKYFITKSITLN